MIFYGNNKVKINDKYLNHKTNLDYKLLLTLEEFSELVYAERKNNDIEILDGIFDLIFLLLNRARIVLAKTNSVSNIIATKLKRLYAEIVLSNFSKFDCEQVNFYDQLVKISNLPHDTVDKYIVKLDKRTTNYFDPNLKYCLNFCDNKNEQTNNSPKCKNCKCK